MTYPSDPYALLWQEMSPLQRLVQQFDALLAMLAAYALLLAVGLALVLISAALSALIQRVEESRELPQERALRSATPAIPLPRSRHRPHVSCARLARPTPGGKGMRWRSTFSPYFHRSR